MISVQVGRPIPFEAVSVTDAETSALKPRRARHGRDGDADHRQVLRRTADHYDVGRSPATVVYAKRGLGITALEPTRGR